MIIRTEKGYALAMSMMLLIVLVISSFGLYYLIERHTIGIRVKEVKHIRGYYGAIAGLRYAAILLKNPGNYFTDPDFLETYEVTGNKDDELGGTTGENFFDDIGVDSADLTITIEERTDGDYDITATYKY